MTVQDVADAHYQAQQTIARNVADQGQALWSQIQPASILESWLALLESAVRILIAGQAAAANLAQPYTEALATAQGVPPLPAGILNPSAFAGWAADGRALDSLLMQPALRTLGLLAAGADDQDALRSGLASLTRILATETTDAGRAAAGAALIADRSFVTYVRLVSLPACGRCIILAGREYSWSTGFLRHERCDCQMVARAHKPGEGFDPAAPASPQALFAQMTQEEQDKAFTSAGAQAIRDGADLGQVVNARRGLTVAGGRSVTTEGTTVRGHAGRRLRDFQKVAGERYRRSRIPRPTPQQIYRDADGDRDEAIRLLERFGYLTPAASAKAGRKREQAEAEEREAARRQAEAQAKLRPEGKARRYHRDLAGIEDLAAAVEDGFPPQELRRLGGGAVAEVELLTLKGGRKVIRKTARPASGGIQEAAGEQIASKVARALGLRAPKVYRRDEDEIFMDYVDAKTADEITGWGQDPPRRVKDAPATDDGKILGLVDVLIHNFDRNAGNWMLDDEDLLIPIDHGVAYTEMLDGGRVDLEYVSSAFAQHYTQGDGNPLTREDVDEVRRRLGELRPDFEHLGRPEWLDYSLRVLEVLAPNARGMRNLIAGVR